MSQPESRSRMRMVWIAAAAWGAALVFCVFLWLVRVGGDVSKLHATRQRVAVAKQTVLGMKRDLNQKRALETESAAVLAELHSITNQHTLIPLLNSYAMRAKDLLTPPAVAAGFAITDARERYRVSLPVVDPKAELSFDRVAVDIVGSGSYDAIARFVAEAEAALPYVTLVGLTVTGERQTPERHKATVVFEWPVQGISAAAAQARRPAEGGR